MVVSRNGKGAFRLKTPPHLRAYGIPEICPSRKLSRVALAYAGEAKAEFLSIIWAMEQSGCLPQPGDPARNVDRVGQLQIAGMLGLTRSTTTKRISRFSAFSLQGCGHCTTKDGRHTFPCACACHNSDWTPEKRRRHSERMRAIAATHPHWRRGMEDENVSDHAGNLPGSLPDSSRPVDGVSADRHETSPHHNGDLQLTRRLRHVGAILVRHAGFGQANSYALMMPAEARPEIKARPDDPQFEARILAHHFPGLFDPAATLQGSSCNGFRRAVGWNWDPHFPDARKCECRLGQRRLGFQKMCPKCEGKGVLIRGSMPDFGRVFFQFLVDRGLIAEIKDKHDNVTKPAGILEGWTDRAIGEAIGLNESTVRRYKQAYAALNIIRVVPGKVWRHCSRCNVQYHGKCGSCGSENGPVKRREPQKFLYLPTRTMDREIVRAERSRLEARLAICRHNLDQRQAEALQNAVALALNVLGEWAGHEHHLEAFWNEMRRRLAATPWLVNVLFPLKT